MGHIRTIEDGFQYRVHDILKKLKKDYESGGMKKTFREWLDSTDCNGAIGEALLDDIEQYCGLDEAIENEY